MKHLLPGILALLLLAGCDKLTGAADQKIADAEAVGFACRISGKTPGDCMQENDGYSPSHILDGWKFADEDIRAGKLDPSMRGKTSPIMEPEAPAAVEQPSEDKAAAGATPEKPAEGS